MKLRTYGESDVRGKRVLVRADLNVPVKDGQITDSTRIIESLPNILKLHEWGARVAVISHLGRPKDAPDPKYAMGPVAKELERLLKEKHAGLDTVNYLTDAIGPNVERALAGDWRGDIVLLENSRFYPGETKNDPEFARELAKPFQVFVNDAFGTAHRAHATTVGVTAFLPSFAGPLIVKEVDALCRITEKPARPLIIITGGKKVSDKLPLLEHLCGRAEIVLVGGAMVFTIARAQGHATGKSLVEEDYVEQCKTLLADYEDSTTKLILPEDIIVTDSIESPTRIENKLLSELEEGDIGVDIGDTAQETFKARVMTAATIFWNGPMGVFEKSPFDAGTIAMATAITLNRNAYSIVGGGESVEAVNKLGYAGGISHISTGGGASLEFVAGMDLPGISVLKA
jgi:phosphoglycerate kinase